MVVSRNLQNMYPVPAYRIQGNEREQKNKNKKQNNSNNESKTIEKLFNSK